MVKPGKIFLFLLSAGLGLFAGLYVFTTLMILEVDTAAMLPQLKPGDHVLVLCDTSFSGERKLTSGDLVVYEAPYYTADGEGLQKIRKVTGTRGNWIRLNQNLKPAESGQLLVKRQEIKGRVILRIPRIEIF